MFNNHIHIRTRYIFFVFVIISILIIGKVLYTKIFMNKMLLNLSLEMYSKDLVITADRGDIIDRNGKVLATSITTTSLYFIPKQIDNKEEVALKVSEIIGCSYEDIYKHVSNNVSIERVHPQGRKLDYDTASKIEALGYDGVYLVKESKRYYPYGDVLSHTLGYVGIDNQGLSGLELMYDDILKGEDGIIKFYTNGKGELINKASEYIDSKKGLTLQLTIDIDLQLAIENELDIIDKKYNPENSLIIVQDPSSGEILAMASHPTFDSNNYQNSSSEVINRNLPIWKTYEPGSTFKIVHTL